MLWGSTWLSIMVFANSTLGNLSYTLGLGRVE